MSDKLSNSKRTRAADVRRTLEHGDISAYGRAADPADAVSALIQDVTAVAKEQRQQIKWLRSAEAVRTLFRYLPYELRRRALRELARMTIAEAGPQSSASTREDIAALIAADVMALVTEWSTIGNAPALCASYFDAARDRDASPSGRGPHRRRQS
jgi:hypothetical protein